MTRPQLRTAGVEFIKHLKKQIKPFVKPFLLILAIYCFSMLAIWRANYSFMDDVGRSVLGYAWISDFFRFSSSVLGYALNFSIGLSDISPFTQVFAMVLLSVTSILFVYIFCDKKLEYGTLILSTFIGLTPFMIGCWVYKFDAPSIALSILASIVPFVFWAQFSKKSSGHKLLILYTAIILCLVLMWTSYQAASGIYLVMLASLVLKDFLERANPRVTLRKFAVYGSLYLLSALVFKLITYGFTVLGEAIFNKRPSGGYRGTEIFNLLQMPSGVMQNIKHLIESIVTSLNAEWAVLLALILVCFLVSLFVSSKRKSWTRLVDPAAGFIFIVACVPLSYGAFLLLQDAPLGARSIVGIGPVLAVVSIFIARNASKLRFRLLTVPSFILLYSFIIFAFAFGNGLADQKRFADFRTDSLIESLSLIYGENPRITDRPIQLVGNIGMSPILRHVDKEYPVTATIFNDPPNMFGLGDGPWGTAKLRMHYGWKNLSFTYPKDMSRSCKNLPIKLEGYFYTIRSDEAGNTCVVIK